MEKAILKAIDGGYVVDIGWKEKTRQGYCERNRMQLDPLFWQALGKSCPKMGIEDLWHETKCSCPGIDFHISGPDCHFGHCDRVKAPRGYKKCMHDFMDHLIEGKSPDSFFTALLANQE